MVRRDTGAAQVLPEGFGRAVEELFAAAEDAGYRSVVASKFMDDEHVHLFWDGGESYLARVRGGWREVVFDAEGEV